MESFLRGSIEQKIEAWLDDDEKKQVYDIVSYLKQIKIGIEDVILGFIIASIYDSLINLCFAHYYRCYYIIGHIIQNCEFEYK